MCSLLTTPPADSVPTIADFVPGYEDSNWWGFGAPKATPAGIIDKLNQETNAALAVPGSTH
jgi:hypothetical protein